MTVVVGAPDIDSLVKASHELVSVIGDIGKKICRVSVGSDKNVIFQLELFYLGVALALLL